MKQFILLLFFIPFIGCSDKEEDYSNKKEQELWLDGYTTTSSSINADKKANIIRFLFFKEDQAINFEGKNYKTGFDSYYEYTQLTEDAIYTRLLDKGELLLKDGRSIKPLLDTQTSSNGKTKEIVLPVGKYFVVAFYYDRGARRDYWNKYATKIYDLESRYNPQALTVVIPVDYTQYGKIDWRNWQD